ncbi:MAG: hypothetical protein JEY99_11965 [Spirochaetales bacterium]|nr:hypothetical protein [Spirochaetales bacterium]
MKIFFILMFTCFLFSGPLSAQELDSFEDSFLESSEEEEKGGTEDAENEDGYEDDEESEGLAELLLELFVRLTWYAVAYGGSYSNDRVDPPNYSDYYIRPRRTGEPLIPIFRSDTSFGIIDPELYAADQRFEVGYGAIGFTGRYTLFFETDRISNLHLWETYIHYRMSLGNALEVSPGFGAFGMEGKAEYKGFSLSLPVKMYVPDAFALEAITAFNFYPTEVVGTDFDISLMLDLGRIYPKAGYRIYGTGTSFLETFYLGCSFIY